MRLSVTQVFLGSGMVVAGVRGDCHKDNCHRALFPCRPGLEEAWTRATSFWATVTAWGTTVTDYPNEAASDWKCGTAGPDPYISACACGPSCTPASQSSATSTATPCVEPPVAGLVQGGEFECSRVGAGEDWDVKLVNTAAAYNVSAPGHSGPDTNALYVSLLGPRETPVLGASARISSRAVAVVPNVPLRVAYWLFFDNFDGVFVGLKINGLPRQTTDSRHLDGVAVWKKRDFVFTPGTDEGDDGTEMRIEFEVLFGGDVPMATGLDGVEVAWLH